MTFLLKSSSIPSKVLLCTRHCASLWRYRAEKTSGPSLRSYSPAGETGTESVILRSWLFVKGRQTHTDSLIGGSSRSFLLWVLVALTLVWQTQHHCLIFWISDSLLVAISGSRQVPGVSEMQLVFVASPWSDTLFRQIREIPFTPTHVCSARQPFILHNLCSKLGILWLIRVTWGCVLPS